MRIERVERGDGLPPRSPDDDGRGEWLAALVRGERLAAVVPVVITIVERDPLASAGFFPGDLLRGLMEVPGDFWRHRPQEYDRYRAALRASAALRRRQHRRERMEFWSPIPLPPAGTAAYLRPTSASETRNMWSDFKAFLIKQNALALAIAVVIGAALNQVVDGIVKGLIMPIVAAATPGGTWQTMEFAIGSVKFGIGLVLAALLNFIIVGIVAWRLSKMFIREAPAAPKPAVKPCPYCLMEIDALATRCAHCTSELAAVGLAPSPVGATSRV